MSHSFCISVKYDADKEEADISYMNFNHKKYDRIRTEGDLGTAVKDYVMGMRQEGKI